MPVKLHKRGKIWHYRGTVSGRRLRGSTGTSDKKCAERIAAEVEHKAWQRRLEGPGAGVTMAQVFIAYLEAQKSERFLLRLADYWKNTPVAEVRAETIRQAARKIYPDAHEPTWNRQVIKPTQAAINHAAALGWCDRISVKRYTETPEIKTPATLEWVTAFTDQARKDDLPRLAAICLFMFGTAARVGEACELRWSGVNLDASTAELRLFKPTPWTRIAHLPEVVTAALLDIKSNRPNDGRVFEYAGRGSLRGAWNGVCKRAGIERLTPHCCRHGFATSMLHKGFDPKTVAERGGWKDATTVLRTYAHAMTDPTVTDALFDANLTRKNISNRTSK